jgi:hypothetical protein
MDFLKKHYEKILFGVVLLALIAAAGVLPFLVSSERKDLEDKRTQLTAAKVPALTNLSMAVAGAALDRMAQPTPVVLGDPNKLFNPLLWLKSPEGKLVPGKSMGPNQIVITNLNPLYLVISNESVMVYDSGCKYVLSVQRQAAVDVNKRGKRSYYCTTNAPGNKNDAFTLIEIKGKAEEPSEIVIEMADTNERAALSKEKPFKRVDGYTADLRYDPEKRVWPRCRVGSGLTFNGEEYTIVSITQSEVVLSAKSNQKKWTIKYNPAP